MRCKTGTKLLRDWYFAVKNDTDNWQGKFFDNAYWDHAAGCVTCRAHDIETRAKRWGVQPEVVVTDAVGARAIAQLPDMAVDPELADAETREYERAQRTCVSVEEYERRAEANDMRYAGAP